MENNQNILGNIENFLSINNEFGRLLTYGDIFIILTSSLALSLIIFYTYKLTYRGILYTENFNRSLVLVSVVTSIVILTISSNIVLSLGMVGALSIVRFRTAIKDPMDIVFMFWAIAVGISNGAGFFKISIAGTIFIAAIFIVFANIKGSSNPYLVVIKFNKNFDIYSSLNSFGNYRIKSKIISGEEVEMTIETRMNDKVAEEINNISSMKEVYHCTAISYNGDYIS